MMVLSDRKLCLRGQWKTTGSLSQEPNLLAEDDVMRKLQYIHS